MAANSVILLPSNSHDNTSHDTPYTGEKFKGAGFYGMGDGFHTAQIQLTTFTGTIVLQGSLATDPGEDDWIDINFIEQGLSGEGVDTTGAVNGINALTDVVLNNSSINKVYNFTGNFVWIRAKVLSWTGGHINRVLLNF